MVPEPDKNFYCCRLPKTSAIWTKNLSEFSLRIATTLTELSSAAPQDSAKDQSDTPGLRVPHGIVGLYCITPNDPTDSGLQQFGRSLAIELPFNLTEAGRRKGLDLVFRGPDLKDLATGCDSNPTSLGGTRTTQSSDSRIENFSWAGSLSRDPNDSKVVRLVMSSMDRTSGDNFRPLPPISIRDPAPAALPSISQQLVSSFVQQYSRAQYRLFLHIGTDKITPDLEGKITSALLDAGFYVVGSDRLKDWDVRPGVDYFYDGDCSGAADVRAVISPIFPNPKKLPLRKKNEINNRPGTLGVWIADKAPIPDDPISCR